MPQQAKRKMKGIRNIDGKQYFLTEILPENERIVTPVKGTRKRKITFKVSEGDKAKAKKYHKERGFEVRIFGNKLYTHKKE